MKRRDFILGLVVTPFLGKAILDKDMLDLERKESSVNIIKDCNEIPSYIYDGEWKAGIDYYLQDVVWHNQQELIKRGFKGFDE